MAWSLRPSFSRLAGSRPRAGVLSLLQPLLLFAGLALLAHLLTILLVPRVAVNDAVTRFAQAGATGSALILRADAQRSAPHVDPDPAMVTAVCGYDLSEGPFRIRISTGALPLSVALHLRGGGIAYAATDRVAVRDVLEFVIMSRLQFEERQAAETETDNELSVISPTDTGLVVARVLTRWPSERGRAEELAAGMVCGLAD